MTEQFSNKAQTTLNGAITNVATSLVVTSATGFPTSGNFRILIKAEGANTDEIITVTAVSGTTFTVTRASEALAGVQSASAHASGATVAHVLTAGALQNTSSLLGANTVVLVGNFTTSSSTPQVVSASLDTTVEVGLSGRIICQIGANWQMDSGFNGYVCILESTTNVGEITFWSGSNSPAGMFGTILIPIVGISPGSHTYRLAIRTNGGGTMKVIALSTITFMILNW